MPNDVDQDLIDEVAAEVEEMDEATLTLEAEKALAARAKRASYRTSTELTPEQKETRKRYRQKRYQKEKLILARAKELGLVPEPEEAE